MRLLIIVIPWPNLTPYTYPLYLFVCLIISYAQLLLACIQIYIRIQRVLFKYQRVSTYLRIHSDTTGILVSQPNTEMSRQRLSSASCNLGVLQGVVGTLTLPLCLVCYSPDQIDIRKPMPSFADLFELLTLANNVHPRPRTGTYEILDINKRGHPTCTSKVIRISLVEKQTANHQS